MHYCSEEVEAATTADARAADALEAEYVPALRHAVSRDKRSHDIVPRLAGLSLHPDSGELMAELEDSLEELEDGLDVLMILEKAYQKTMQDHVAPLHSEKASAAPPSPAEKAEQAPVAPPTCSPPQPQNVPHGTAPRRPLVEGSSTALVAVLDHPHAQTKRSRPLQLFGPTPRRADPEPAVSERGAILTIAHLGDCMGMLIRGEEIVWRTEEMWWNVSVPECISLF